MRLRDIERSVGLALGGEAGALLIERTQHARER
jgi:3-oxoacyl-(acyl-carrier-protein) synthase